MLGSLTPVRINAILSNLDRCLHCRSLKEQLWDNEGLENKVQFSIAFNVTLAPQKSVILIEGMLIQLSISGIPRQSSRLSSHDPPIHLQSSCITLFLQSINQFRDLSCFGVITRMEHSNAPGRFKHYNTPYHDFKAICYGLTSP